MYISSGSNSNIGQSFSGLATEILSSGSGNSLLTTPRSFQNPTYNYEVEYNSDHLGDEVTIFCLVMIVIVIGCCCFSGCQVGTK